MIGCYQVENNIDNEINEEIKGTDEFEQFKNEILDHLSNEFKEYEFIKEERRNYLFYPFI